MIRTWENPAILAPFSTDEWVWSDAYTTSLSSGARCLAISRAVTMATCAESDALIWMTPPPGPVVFHPWGRSSRSTIQSTTTVSSSVAAGDVDQSMPCTPRPAATISPSSEGPELLAGK